MDDAFAWTMNPLELVLRGTAMYWFLFLIFRYVLRRDAGALGIADILLLVLVADSAQNAMSGGYDSVPEGMVLVGTIVGWNWLVDWCSYHYRWARRLAEPQPLVLVRHGRMLPHHMAREYVTTQELLSRLREQGIDKLEDVKIARMEPDGQISVIPEPHARAREDGAGVSAGGPQRSPPAA